MQTGLARYGFKRNPFRVRVDPLADPTHSDWIVRVDGFSRLNEIDDLLIRTCSNPQPLFFLVTGKSGTGRTSVANYILGRYRDHRGISKDRFVIPEDRRVRSHDEYTTFKNWLIYLIDDVDELSPVIALPSNLLTTINSAERDTMEAVFQGVVRRISNKVGSASPPSGFGCCLEDIPTYRFISAAFSIFAKAHTVCVFTAGDYEEWQREVIQPFKKATVNYPESIV